MSIPHVRSINITAGTQYVIAFNIAAVPGFDWDDVSWVSKVRDVPGGSLLATPSVTVSVGSTGAATVRVTFAAQDTKVMPPSVVWEVSGRIVSPEWGPHVFIRRRVSIEQITADFD